MAGASLRGRGARREIDLVVPAAGVATVLAACLSVRFGAQLSVSAVLAAGCFIGVCLLFLGKPHVAIAMTVVLFALIPALKVLVSPLLGSVKDLDALAAATAAVLFGVLAGRRVDRPVLGLVALLLVLYVVNAGGERSIAWAQGLRLVGEPLLLLVVGLILPDPRRNLRWASVALIGSASFAAAYGLVQQGVGDAVLVGWGYSYGEQVRTVGPFLRSFGTSDDPFTYAAMLLFGIAALIFLRRRDAWTLATAALLLAGLTASLVRTALLILAAFVGLALARQGRAVVAVLMGLATVLAGAVILATTSATETQSFAVSTPTGTAITSRPGTTNVILNGRVSAWASALGDEPRQWVFGRGVGEVGTAASRAGFLIDPSTSKAPAPSLAVDSGYLATVADVGVLGLVVLLGLLVRLAQLAWQGGRRNDNAGWFGLALIAALALDALTRSSFTGFPTAFLALLLAGICVAAVQEDVEAAGPRRPPPRRSQVA